MEKSLQIHSSDKV